MNKKAFFGIMVALLIIGILPLTFPFVTGSSSTKIYIDPPSIVDLTLTTGSNFTVKAMVSDVEADFGCCYWQVMIRFDPDILQCVNVTEGDFLKDRPGGTFGFSTIEEGFAYFGWGRMDLVGVMGNGTLARVEFQVVGVGNSNIYIARSPWTYLLERHPPPVPPGQPEYRYIPCSLEDGYFHNERIIYIRADGSIDPPTANITSPDNVTYFFTDNNNGKIVVERNSVMIDGKGYSLQGAYAWDSKGIDLTGRNNITIRNTEIRAFVYGIGLSNSSNNTITGNNITYNRVGIRFDDSSNNTISGNNIKDNEASGTVLASSFENTIEDNTVENNTSGIYLGWSSNNTLENNIVLENSWDGIYLDGAPKNVLRGNNMTDNTYNFGVSVGFGALEAEQDIDSSNTVNGRPIYYWVDEHDKRVPKGAGYVAAIRSTNITVEDQCLTHNHQGVLFRETSESSIKNVTTSHNFVGVEVIWSHWITISECTVAENFRGMDIDSNNTILRSVISNNTYGITVGDNVKILENIIDSNARYGAALYKGNQTIVDNTLSNNNCSIYMYYDSRNSRIYHNNFINNTQHVLFQTHSNPNFWDDGYPSGGNYWDDYKGSDSFWGAGQNETGSDGIGDTLYTIDDYNQDNYPLMSPYKYWGNPIPGDINKDMKVDHKDLLILAAAYGSSSDEPNWNPYTDLNEDGEVDHKDLLILASNYGEEA